MFIRFDKLSSPGNGSISEIQSNVRWNDCRMPRTSMFRPNSAFTWPNSLVWPDVLLRASFFSAAVWYDAGSRRALPDPAVEAMLIDHARARGIVRRAFQPAEIVDRCLLGMINEAASILDEGVVARASDIDVVWLTGYGFPRFRGGPLYYADRLGLPRVVERIEALRDRFGAAYWTPAPALKRLAATGRGFYWT